MKKNLAKDTNVILILLNKGLEIHKCACQHVVQLYVALQNTDTSTDNMFFHCVVSQKFTLWWWRIMILITIIVVVVVIVTVVVCWYCSRGRGG
jgi:uncharacterized membrane protein